MPAPAVRTLPPLIPIFNIDRDTALIGFPHGPDNEILQVPNDRLPNHKAGYQMDLLPRLTSFSWSVLDLATRKLKP
jgi:hypothetical protein